MSMDVKATIRNLIRRFGLDLHHYNPQADPARRRNLLLAQYRVDVVLDVGANIGQFGVELRRAGYHGRIVSFEPLSSAFRQLAIRAATDPAWSTHDFALSNLDSTATLNIAGNSMSSSLLGMLATHSQSAPESAYVGTERIRTRRLDAILDTLATPGTGVYLKIDTQGAELKVLEGAGDALNRIDTLELELSLVPLYEGGPLLPDMMALLAAKGYDLVGLEAGFSDARTGRLLQIDGIFHRSRPTQFEQDGGIEMPRKCNARGDEGPEIRTMSGAHRL
jgi:FkbM family methyltransferase